MNCIRGIWNRVIELSAFGLLCRPSPASQVLQRLAQQLRPARCLWEPACRRGRKNPKMSCIRGIWNRGIELSAFGPALQAIAGKPAPTRAGATITASAVLVGAGLPAMRPTQITAHHPSTAPANTACD